MALWTVDHGSVKSPSWLCEKSTRALRGVHQCKTLLAAGKQTKNVTKNNISLNMYGNPFKRPSNMLCAEVLSCFGFPHTYTWICCSCESNFELGNYTSYAMMCLGKKREENKSGLELKRIKKSNIFGPS